MNGLSGVPHMKPSLWFEVAMLALILIASLVYVVANEPDRRRVATEGDRTAQIWKRDRSTSETAAIGQALRRCA